MWRARRLRMPYIEAAGFSALYRIQWLRLDKPLITTLVERWRSETNTFHLANDEMTITLEDVAVLLGLRIDGDAVTGSTRGDWMELARVLLGVELPPGSFQGRRLSPSWIRGQFSFCPDDAPEELWAWERLHTGRPTLLEEPALQGGPLGSRWNVRRTNATNPGGNLVLYRTELDHQWSYQVKWQSYLDFMKHLPAICIEGRRIWLSRTPLICFKIIELHVPDRVMLQFGLEQVTPPEDVEHVTRISRKGRAREDWALYHRDYIDRWEARAESVITGNRAHTRRHAPNDYMMWYLGATRRFISPPPTEPAMVYHPRGYTEEALLGCVRNVVERVNYREALYPSSADPYLMEIGHYCQSVLHSLPLLEGAIVDGDVSHAGEPCHVVEPARDRAPRARRARHHPTVETTTPVEDSDEVPAVPEPMVPDLPPEQNSTRSPTSPLSSPRSLSPAATLPFGGFIQEGRKRQLVHQRPVLLYD
ncbi:hypothetical protein H6P81_015853 [Aristolochia fimbriata]|uniref:Aminotransferase-like plant mobile domain-containing protein n=1 Tax=Aristolochia fimbriata TaxID=158543 RepID=A0AAV7EBA4_ARIFI|nr:hypothetical protein H6P81_015853 [Aristolochia fimbriata]